MLVLSRGPRESVLVGETIRVMPLAITEADDETPLHDARVRLGFVAPKDVTILREEVARRMASGSGGRPSSSPSRRKALPGYTEEIPDVRVRLQLSYPPQTAVHLSRCANTGGAKHPTLQTFPPAADGNVGDGPASLEIVCRKNDSLLIGHVTIVVVEVCRFICTAAENSVLSKSHR